MFQIIRLTLDDADNVVVRRPLQPLFELRDDAMAMAEFDASRLWGDYGRDEERDCWWATDSRGNNIASRSKRSRRPTLRPEVGCWWVPFTPAAGAGTPAACGEMTAEKTVFVHVRYMSIKQHCNGGTL